MHDFTRIGSKRLTVTTNGKDVIVHAGAGWLCC